MSLYLDASVIVPSLIAEPSSERVRDWLSLAETEFVISGLVHGEVLSALYRAVKQERETFADIATRVRIFEGSITSVWTSVSHIPADMGQAVEFVRRFDLALRMPDALHLAICRRLGLTLATFDRRLLRAAEALGVAAVRPA